MILGRPWLRDAKVEHDWGRNQITLGGPQAPITIHVLTQGYIHHQSQPDQLEGYDWTQGLTDEQEHNVLAANPAWVTVGSIDLDTLYPRTTSSISASSSSQDDQTMDHREVLTSEPDRSEPHLPEPIGPIEQTDNRLTGPNPADPHRFPPQFYSHRTAETVPINKTLARDAVQAHHIAEWTLARDEDIRLLNLGTATEARMVKINRHLPVDF